MSYKTIANQDSVYNHKLNEFKDYFRQIDYKSTTVSDALVSFRESSYLPNKYKRMTCTELSANPKLILQLREDLGNRMAPPGRLKTSRKQKEFRQRELIDNLAEYNKSIDKERAICNIITGRYDDGERTYNYTIEVVAAPLKHSNVDDAGKVEIIGNINSSPAIDGGEHYFENGYYVWTDKRSNTHKESGGGYPPAKCKGCSQKVPRRF